MLHIVLFAPEIPQNTGNIGRLCAVSRCRLHLIHPLGFAITDRQLRRSGMDYWRRLDVHEHANWEAYRTSAWRAARLWLFSTRAQQSFWNVQYAAGDGLLFGRETAGCPPEVHAAIGMSRCVKIDQADPSQRCLNLATSVGIATYEALRQLRPAANKLGQH